VIEPVIELPVVVGEYHLVSFMTNAPHMQRDPGSEHNVGIYEADRYFFHRPAGATVAMSCHEHQGNAAMATASVMPAPHGDAQADHAGVELRRGTAGYAGDASFTGSDSAGMTP
jgi:hypothetical protein